MLCDDYWLPLLLMFLSVPTSHLSGVLAHQHCGYNFVQPFFGGFKYVTAQSFGWLIYAIALSGAIISALNGWLCATQNMLPLLFFAQATISSSVLWFEALPEAEAQNRDKEEQLAHYKIDWSTAVLCMSTVAALHVVLAATSGTATLGWIVLTTICMLTVAGLHMVWTHVWLIASAAVLLTGNSFALSVVACLGVNISGVWYLVQVTPPPPQDSSTDWDGFSGE